MNVEAITIIGADISTGESSGSLASSSHTSHSPPVNSVEKVRGLLAQSRELRSRRRIADYWRINHALHFVIGELTANLALRALWDRLYFQAAAAWYGCTEEDFEAVAGALAVELNDVLRAMTERDVAAVGYVQRNCIAAGLRRLQACAAAAGPGR